MVGPTALCVVAGVARRAESSHRRDFTIRRDNEAAAALQAWVDDLERRIRPFCAVEAPRRPPMSGQEIMYMLDASSGFLVVTAITMLLSLDP
jgi:hypothetical protein